VAIGTNEDSIFSLCICKMTDNSVLESCPSLLEDCTLVILASMIVVSERLFNAYLYLPNTPKGMNFSVKDYVSTCILIPL